MHQSMYDKTSIFNKHMKRSRTCSASSWSHGWHRHVDQKPTWAQQQRPETRFHLFSWHIPEAEDPSTQKKRGSYLDEEVPRSESRLPCYSSLIHRLQVLQGGEGRCGCKLLNGRIRCAAEKDSTNYINTKAFIQHYCMSDECESVLTVIYSIQLCHFNLVMNSCLSSQPCVSAR